MRRPGSRQRGSRLQREERASHQRGGTAGVAGGAIRIDGKRPDIAGIGHRQFIRGRRLMFVLVMPEVLRRAVGLVLAIGSYCGPAELERQQDQQGDGKPAAHGAGF